MTRDELRERVARAICEAVVRDWMKDVDPALSAADAAIAVVVEACAAEAEARVIPGHTIGQPIPLAIAAAIRALSVKP